MILAQKTLHVCACINSTERVHTGQYNSLLVNGFDTWQHGMLLLKRFLSRCILFLAVINKQVTLAKTYEMTLLYNRRVIFKRGSYDTLDSAPC